MKSPISTFKRYLYLNLYAILLLVFGGIAIGVPFWKLSLWALLPQSIAFLTFLNGAINIFKSWEDKQRKYAVLIQRNSSTFRPDTFKEYMQAPCGRLLTRVVLKDLNLTHEYKALLKYRQPFYKLLIKECTRNKNAVIYISNN